MVSLPIPSGTPLKPKFPERFTSKFVVEHESEYDRLVKDMAHEFVGPMPVEDFFKAFVNPGRPYTEPSLPKQWRGKFRAKLIKKLGFENSFVRIVFFYRIGTCLLTYISML